MNTSIKLVVAAASLLTATGISAQALPQIPFDAVDPLRFPNHIHLGEAAGVARNSSGEIFVYTRTGNPTINLGVARAVAHGGSRLFQFDANGNFVREIGTGLYSFLVAQQVRVDAQDNVWIVDQLSNQVVKFDPSGRVQMVLGRKPEATRVPAAEPPANPRAGAGSSGESFSRPADVAWDAAGNIYVADGYGNSRIAKYDPNGKWLMNWGERGAEPGQFDMISGIAVDAQGNVYVADRGNGRIQVFDGEGNFRTQFGNLGSPAAICLTPGPRQYLYVSDSNPPDDLEYAGKILKMELDGRIVGTFGSVGKQLGQFGTVNALDCRSENDLLIGELGNWRVQRVALRPAAR
jgi:DNA-binding beta-propeller fold protein YncE